MGGNTESYIDTPPGEQEEKELVKEFNQLKNSPYVPVVKCEFVNHNKKHWQIVFNYFRFFI